VTQSSALRAIVEAIEQNEIERALRLLVDAEWDAFTSGGRVGGDLAYARTRLVANDRDGALAELRRLLGSGE
jgi:hypothetical protein